MKFIAFLPIRNPSERVPGKNTRLFAGIEGGLTAIKVRQLCAVQPAFDLIVVSTNESEIRKIVSETASEHKASVCIIKEDWKPGWGADELIRHAAQCFSHHPDDTAVLWTHVTSPFFGDYHYQNALGLYHEALLAGHDSLMTAQRVESYLWWGRPMWDRTNRLWPRTQDLSKTYEIDSACFIAPLKIYREKGDRIGDNPYIYETDRITGLDIDWPKDWKLAELIWRARHG